MSTSGGKESRPPPPQLVHLRYQPTGPSNLAEIVSMAAVDFVTPEMTDLSSFAGKESVGLAVSKSFAATGPEPIDIGQHVRAD